ncbi:uncharacterized protein TNIN_7891 [Trichonephila inaurata madagascariensis]|uniref:Gustatory receptor n=1 Tax=Trichonephila inaurata madagascariensis TaxID=2747483 RepID=A0A8X6YAI0_9ARAC|nr:uncharacterized protein TNIN_7891 [Trichonephila inaurata madagascariensis]
MVYLAVYRQHRSIRQMIEDLDQIFKKFPKCKLTRKKYPLMALFLSLQVMRICLKLPVYFLDPIVVASHRTFFRSDLVTKHLKLPSSSSFIVLQTCELLFIFMSRFTLSVFALYYSLTCKYIQVLLQNLIQQFNNVCMCQDLKNLLCVYGDISKYMSTMDTEFSFLVFVTVLVNMIGLFWSGYRLAIHSDISNVYFLSLMTSGLFYLTHQLTIMNSASSTNEMGKKLKHVALYLPYRFPKHSQEIKSTLKKDFMQDNHLTVWKIYEFNRSLTISSLGTLLTYGILIGSLGKEI